MKSRQHERDVIAKLFGGGKRRDVFEDAVVERRQVGISRGIDEGDDAIEGVELAGFVSPVGQSICVDEERVAGRDLKATLLEQHRRHRAQEMAGNLVDNRATGALLEKQKRRVGGVGVDEVAGAVNAEELRGGDLVYSN